MTFSVVIVTTPITNDQELLARSRALLRPVHPEDGFAPQLRGVIQLHLFLDAGAVCFNGRRTQVEFRTDLAGRTAASDQFEDLQFTVRQSLYSRHLLLTVAGKITKNLRCHLLAKVDLTGQYLAQGGHDF